MRVAKAQSEFAEFAEAQGELVEDDDEKALLAKLRMKYDIPEGVYLWDGGLGTDLAAHNAKTCKPYLASFVRGKLTENAMADLIFYFDEIDECDYGWILVERPMGFYGRPSDEDIDDVLREIISIGTRSRSKNTKLPRIAGAFSCQ